MCMNELLSILPTRKKELSIVLRGETAVEEKRIIKYFEICFLLKNITLNYNCISIVDEFFKWFPMKDV